MNGNQDVIQLVGSVEEATKIINNQPKFIVDAIDQSETMFNIRTRKYIERAGSRVLIQLDDGEEYFHTTMPYHSSFYTECVKLCDLQKALVDLGSS